MQSFDDDAIVLSVVPYGDDDIVARLFLRGGGRVSAFARAARKSRRRFAAGVQPFSMGGVTLKERRGDAMLSLEAGSLSPILLAHVVEPVVLGRATYLCELIERLLPEGEPHLAVFDDVTRAIGALPFSDARLLRAFELRLLRETGTLPDLSPLGGGPVVAFDPVDARLLPHATTRTVPFTDSAARAAVALLEAALPRVPEIDDETLRVVGRIFAAHLRRHGGAPLKSIAFLRALARTEAVARAPFATTVAPRSEDEDGPP